MAKTLAIWVGGWVAALAFHARLHGDGWALIFLAVVQNVHAAAMSAGRR